MVVRFGNGTGTAAVRGGQRREESIASMKVWCQGPSSQEELDTVRKWRSKAVEGINVGSFCGSAQVGQGIRGENFTITHITVEHSA